MSSSNPFDIQVTLDQDDPTKVHVSATVFSNFNQSLNDWFEQQKWDNKPSQNKYECGGCKRVVITDGGLPSGWTEKNKVCHAGSTTFVVSTPYCGKCV